MSEQLKPLLPCPFCGGEAKFYEAQYVNGNQSSDERVKCGECDAEVNALHAITTWNTRPTPDVAGDVVRNKLSELVGRGLNLCAESRTIDKEIQEAPNDHCGTPYMWMKEKYEEKLAQWERDASNALSAMCNTRSEPQGKALPSEDGVVERRIKNVAYNGCLKDERGEYCEQCVGMATNGQHYGPDRKKTPHKYAPYTPDARFENWYNNNCTVDLDLTSAKLGWKGAMEATPQPQPVTREEIAGVVYKYLRRCQASVNEYHIADALLSQFNMTRK